jgi:hypothetical protein
MAQPGGHGPVGPLPPAVADDPEAQVEYDKLRRRVLWSMPYVLGSGNEKTGQQRT